MISDLNSYKKHLSSSPQEAKEQIKRYQAKISEIHVHNMKKTAEMQRKLAVGPNSWTEMHFRSKNRKTRTYVRRFGTQFKVVVEQLGKDTGRDYSRFVFKHQDKPVTNMGSSLQQVGFAFSCLRIPLP